MPLPTLIEGFIITNEVCSYGCNSPAKFAFKNGKFCCSRTSNKCTYVRQVNSIGISAAHAAGKFSKIDRKKSAPLASATLLAYHSERISNMSFDEKSQQSKRKQIKEEQDSKCLHCGLCEWNNKRLVLELDHIDGNTDNNTRANLRLLCPNCHSQTPTWRKRKQR